MVPDQLEQVLAAVSGNFLVVLRELVPCREEPLVRMN